jgi:uncharacterized membrane protein YvlD (DUF360 family)
MRNRFDRKLLILRVGLFVFLIAAVCLGISSFFQRLSVNKRPRVTPSAAK